MTGRLILLAACLSGIARAGVLQVLEDFETAGNLPSTGVTGLVTEVSGETESGRGCLKVTVAKAFNWRWRGWNGQQDGPLDAIRLAVLSTPYLPPEADAVRMRVRIGSGRAILAVGGPVSQLGNSDVFCDPQLLDLKDGSAWRTVEFSLNQRVARNFRRPNFSADLPVVYYTRWAQEPLYLCLVALPEPLRAEEDTVLWVDQVELVARGEGKPFPSFDESSVTKVASIADFDTYPQEPRVYSVGHGYSIAPSFEAGYRRATTNAAEKIPGFIRASSPFIREEGLAYPAPRYTRVEGANGTGALQAEGVWAEEGQIVTLKTRGHEQANALALTLKADFPAPLTPRYSFVHAGQPAHVVDFVVFVAPPGEEFPWRDLEASDELQQALQESGYQGPGARYDYLLAAGRAAAGVRVPDIRKAGAFGFYTARRYVPAGAWSKVLVPFDDFICVYGQGACQDLQRRQAPLRPEWIAAIGWLAPYGARHGTIAVDEVAYARVPGAAADLRSFWQAPEPASVRMIPLTFYQQYRTWTMMTLGEDAPAFLQTVAPAAP